MRSERSKLPPIAPGRLPLAGHLPRLLRGPLRFLEATREGGGIVTVCLGRSPAYVLNDPALVQRMLVDDVAHFDKGVQYDELRALLGGGLSTTTGVAHRARRRLMQPAFHHERVAGYADLIRETTLSVTSAWRPGEVIDLADEMRSLSLTVVARAFCSTELKSTAVAEIQRDLPTVMRGITWRALSPFPVLGRLPLPYNRRFQAATGRLRAAVDDLVSQHADVSGPAGADEAAGDDLLSLLLARPADGSDAALSREEIRDELVNLLFAGTETTGNALSWLWHVLATEPEVERRILRDSVSGDHGYTLRAVNEVLRLYPPPWLITRRVRSAVELGGHRLPVGATVLFSPYAIQRDPALYPDPEKFDPDRWRFVGDAAPPRHAYLPFGSGQHKCIGDRFALLEMVTVATSIVRSHRLVPIDNVEPKASATLVPNRMKVRIETRRLTEVADGRNR